jgi:hypothetical protein
MQSGVVGISSSHEVAVETAFTPVEAGGGISSLFEEQGGAGDGRTRRIELEQCTCRREKVCVGVQRTAWLSAVRAAVVFAGVGAAFSLRLGVLAF